MKQRVGSHISGADKPASNPAKLKIPGSTSQYLWAIEDGAVFMVE
jgi:hypothetical protein